MECTDSGRITLVRCSQSLNVFCGTVSTPSVPVRSTSEISSQSSNAPSLRYPTLASSGSFSVLTAGEPTREPLAGRHSSIIYLPSVLTEYTMPFSPINFSLPPTPVSLVHPLKGAVPMSFIPAPSETDSRFSQLSNA